MALTQAPMPVRNPMINAEDGLITRQWRTWLRGRADIVNETPIKVGSVGLTGQTASVPATAVPMVVVGGLYRVSVFARRTVLATTSSALGVVIRFISGGAALSVATAVSNVNTLAETVTGSWLIRADPGSAITYEVAYGSVGATAMVYSLDLVVEQVQV